MKGLLTISVIAAAALVVPITAGAQVADIPASIPYQGHLTDAGGIDISGTVTVEARLYDSLIAGLGQPVTNLHVIYAETHPAVAVEKGNFRIAIGDGAPLTAPLAIDELIANESVYLELRVNGELMTPRQRLGSVAAAFRANRARYADDIVNLGMIPSERMPAYSAARLTEGTLAAARVPGLSAAVVTGSLAQSNLPTSIDVGKFSTTDNLSEAMLAGLSADKIASGIVETNLLPMGELFDFGDVVIKIGTLIHGQHLIPPPGFDLASQCHYSVSVMETSGAVEGIDKMIVHVSDATGNFVCRVCGGWDDNIDDCIMCNAHYMMLCKRED